MEERDKIQMEWSCCSPTSLKSASHVLESFDEEDRQNISDVQVDIRTNGWEVQTACKKLPESEAKHTRTDRGQSDHGFVRGSATLSAGDAYQKMLQCEGSMWHKFPVENAPPGGVPLFWTASHAVAPWPRLPDPPARQRSKRQVRTQARAATPDLGRTRESVADDWGARCGHCGTLLAGGGDCHLDSCPAAHAASVARRAASTPGVVTSACGSDVQRNGESLRHCQWTSDESQALARETIQWYLASRLGDGLSNEELFQAWLRAFHGECDKAWLEQNLSRLDAAFRPIFFAKVRHRGIASTARRASGLKPEKQPAPRAPRWTHCSACATHGIGLPLQEPSRWALDGAAAYRPAGCTDASVCCACGGGPRARRGGLAHSPNCARIVPCARCHFRYARIVP